MGFTWPPTNTEPDWENGWPYYSDGTYSRDPLHVSPEGNVYGQTRWVHTWQHLVWWTGAQYEDVEVSGQVDNFEDLPAGPRPFGEIWLVREYVSTTNEYIYNGWYYDSELVEWRKLRALWEVDGFGELPYPGVAVGAMHLVTEDDVRVYWNGLIWCRYRHSMLSDDEPDRHLPEGFLRTLQPDARVVYYLPTEIGIEPVPGGSGKVLVNLEYVNASRSASVFNTLSVLNWTGSALQAAHIEPATEYNIYLANTDDAFVVSGLPAEGEAPATPDWDYREKLFLSGTEDYNGYLGDSGAGTNARLVGRIETNSVAYSEGGPLFIRELDISIISQTVAFPQTLRDYSDFTLRFLDPDEIRLDRLDGRYGQIFVAGGLYYLGSGYTLDRTDAWIEWDELDPDRIIRHTEALSADTLYYVYLAGDIDPFNFNDENPLTGRPWQAEDEGSEGNYDPDLDMRLELFLSTQAPDNGLLDESWPGSAARHVGQVRTDGNAVFTPSRAISAINVFAYSSDFHAGVAEVSLRRFSATELELKPRRGTAGTIVVAGEDYYADAGGFSLPLSRNTVELSGGSLVSGGAPSSETLYYCYLAAGFDIWSNIGGTDYREALFLSTNTPDDGYLDTDWPGNTARYVGQVYLNASTQIADDYSVIGAFDLLPGLWKITDENGHEIVAPAGAAIRLDLSLRVETEPDLAITGHVLVNSVEKAQVGITDGSAGLTSHTHDIDHGHTATTNTPQHGCGNWTGGGATGWTHGHTVTVSDPDTTTSGSASQAGNDGTLQASGQDLIISDTDQVLTLQIVTSVPEGATLLDERLIVQRILSEV